MSNKQYIPKPVFGTLNEVVDQYKAIYADDAPRRLIAQWLNHCLSHANVVAPSYATRDYQIILNFLYSYRGSHDTFSAYRRELERLLQWSWFVREKPVLKHTREDIEAFIEFCIKPYKRWIGVKTVARFKQVNGEKVPNPQWRPFDAHVSKTEHKAGLVPDKGHYQFSQQALKVMFGILSSFYNYALQEEATDMNPVALIRQKSKFIQKTRVTAIRRLSDKQWQMVIGIAKEKAMSNVTHERGVFILSCLYGMYLRISELVASDRWTPTMSDFFKDAQGHWWFRTVGKGNKARQIAVSQAMLNALRHYRASYLELSPCPLPDEKIPLISHVNNHNKPITSGRPIRKLVQEYFDLATLALQANGEHEEAQSLQSATVHWLRHTGISDDVKTRPREHVRDDAGHSSGAITDRYIDVELIERAKSAKKKRIAN